MLRLLFVIVVAAWPLAGADWLMFGGDPQRTSWAKGETAITRSSVKSLAVEWKLKLENAAKELHSLTVPVIVENVFTPRGVKDIAIVAAASDSLYAIDAENGKLLWRKSFTAEGTAKSQPHWLCPNSLTATPLIEKAGSGGTTVYSIASDGKLHALNVINGEDRIPPKAFIPAFAKTWSLGLLNGVLYTTTSQGCNGVKSGIWAMDLRSPERTVTNFQASTAGAGIWGRAGAAISASGLVFGETGDGSYDVEKGRLSDTVLAVTARDLKLKDYYTPSNRAWITKKDLDMGNMSPVVFPFKKWELVAAAGKEGVIYLLDAKSMGGADHQTPLFRSPLYANEDVDFAGRGFWGAFATWEDAKGARWLYAPAWGPPHSQTPQFAKTNGGAPNGSIMAFRVEEKDGKPLLVPAWISRDLNVPEPPIVANGIVFAVSSGENVRQLDSAGKLMSSKQRAETPAGNARLHAFDAETGAELYSSGDAMSSFTHFGGLAIAGGRIFVTTYDGTVWAFGVKQ
ncbi:MAG: PQQ-binding-like beta-propeller repeat protein [Bryobacteraceae bacterium]